MTQNLLSAAVVIGALKVKTAVWHPEICYYGQVYGCHKADVKQA